MQQIPSTYNSNPKLEFPEHEHLNCPRCDSTNTKFCYYNNYNLSQPRHYCKDCRRYWTKGGTLRKVPIGGGTRSKTTNKRSNKRIAETANPQFQLKPESSDHKTNRSGCFVDGLTVGGSGKDDLNLKMDGIQVKCLSVNRDDDRGWPDLSGFNFP